jgi:nucleoid DNA-binding protein
MINISEFAKEYLLSNRSVEIAGLGHFSTQPMGAQIHPIIHEFKPPQSLLLFEENPDCLTTPAFAGIVASRTDIPIEEAFTLIQQFSNEVKEALRSENSFTIPHFGTFRRNPDHTTTFEAMEDIRLNIEAFGMPSFTLIQHEETESPLIITEPEQEPVSKETTQITEPEISDIDEPVFETSLNEEKPTEQEFIPVPEVTEQVAHPEGIHNEDKPKKRRLIPAWLIILFILAGGASGLYFSGYWKVVYQKVSDITLKKDKTEQAEVTVEAEQPLTPVAQQPETDVQDEFEEELIVSETKVAETVQQDQLPGITSQRRQYYIVADCYIHHYLAEMRMKELQSQGYNSSIPGQTSQGLHIVSYNGFADKSQAEAELQSIRQNVNKHAWLIFK